MLVEKEKKNYHNSFAKYDDKQSKYMTKSPLRRM